MGIRDSFHAIVSGIKAKFREDTAASLTFSFENAAAAEAAVGALRDSGVLCTISTAFNGKTVVRIQVDPNIKKMTREQALADAVSGERVHARIAGAWARVGANVRSAMGEFESIR